MLGPSRAYCCYARLTGLAVQLTIPAPADGYTVKAENGLSRWGVAKW